MNPVWHPGAFTGKRALVTGGSRGIGFAIARAFVNAGAQVAIAARTEPEVQRAAGELSTEGAPVLPFTTDLHSAGAVGELAERAWEALNGIDILVNNAGRVSGGYSALDLPVSVFDDVVAVNLRAPFLLAREVARRMIGDGRPGAIVNVTSIDGIRGRNGGTAYSASKAGLEALTKVLAMEWAAHGIRVNAVAPGLVTTAMTAAVLGTPEEEIEKRHTPLGRFGQPEEIAGAVLYLASDTASFTTGATIITDGGYVLG